MATTRKTIVGGIDSDVLAFTAAQDTQLDLALVEADCIGTAAHVTMLARLRSAPRLFSPEERDAVVAELLRIMHGARSGAFRITERDQDVHLAIERTLTRRLGEPGKRVHTGRSRNDQVAVDLRLYAKEQLLDAGEELAVLCKALLKFSRKHADWPMVGRTHMRPAMPSSVGLWASSHAESLLDDMLALRAAFTLNDHCPLGSAAGYGVPLDIDRKLTAKLLGFRAVHHNVLYAANARGKCESVVLSALAQVMLSLSRLAADLILYGMPEFAYFELPPEYCTGSSIMPQKSNPDVLELIRARTSRVLAHAAATSAVVCGLPGGYNRDIQETKQPFMEGIQTTRACLRVLPRLIAGLRPDKQRLLAAFTPEVFAADQALELVAEGTPFREAYDMVKARLGRLEAPNAFRAVAAKKHLGGTAGLDFDAYNARVREIMKFVRHERKRYHAAVSRLLGVSYPSLA
jgi:argininosuccinate lyase